MNLEEHVIKKEGKMKIMSSLPSVFVDTRQSCHVIDPSLEMGLSHWPSRALSLSLSLCLSCRYLFFSASPAPSRSRRQSARAGCGGERRARRGRPLLLPAASLAGGLWRREARAPPAPGGEARGRATAGRAPPSPDGEARARRRS